MLGAEDEVGVERAGLRRLGPLAAELEQVVLDEPELGIGRERSRRPCAAGRSRRRSPASPRAPRGRPRCRRPRRGRARAPDREARAQDVHRQRDGAERADRVVHLRRARPCPRPRACAARRARRRRAGARSRAGTRWPRTCSRARVARRRGRGRSGGRSRRRRARSPSRRARRPAGPSRATRARCCLCSCHRPCRSHRVVERQRRPTTRYQWQSRPATPLGVPLSRMPVVGQAGEHRADRRPDDPDPEVVERARHERRAEPARRVERGAGDDAEREHADGDREADREARRGS